MGRIWKRGPFTPDQEWICFSIEMQILLACNWNCQCCNQFSNFSSIPWIRKATMTVAQVEKFAQEMRDRNAYVGRIRMLGGEPSLHPKLEEIVKILAELRSEKRIRELEIVSNGSHVERLEKVHKYLTRIRYSGEGAKAGMVSNLSVTPASLGYEGIMCSAPWSCGISFNYYGFFPCSHGAALARLMDDVPRWQRLELPRKPVKKEWPELQQLCNHCSDGLKYEDRDRLRCGPHGHDKNVPNQEKWVQLAPWFNGKQPENWATY